MKCYGFKRRDETMGQAVDMCTVMGLNYGTKGMCKTLTEVIGIGRECFPGFFKKDYEVLEIEITETKGTFTFIAKVIKQEEV